MKPSPGHTT
jgi:Ca2+-binding EF-hand superfamily protein